MLKIKNVTKVYITGKIKRTVLNKISINFRVNEFVAILGPSGSGKTTLLNIVGGLDKYTSGDLIIKQKNTVIRIGIPIVTIELASYSKVII